MGKIILAGMGTLLAIIGVFVYADMNRTAEQNALIESGACEVAGSYMHTPAPTYIRSGDIMVPLQVQPYKVNIWECDGGYSFHREADQ